MHSIIKSSLPQIYPLLENFYGFYGDKASPFRLEPALLAEVLEISRH